MCQQPHATVGLMKQLINMHQGTNFEVIQKCLFSSEFEPRDSLKLQLYHQFNPKGDDFVTAKISWMHR